MRYRPISLLVCSLAVLFFAPPARADYPEVPTDTIAIYSDAGFTTEIYPQSLQLSPNATYWVRVTTDRIPDAGKKNQWTVVDLLGNQMSTGTFTKQAGGPPYIYETSFTTPNTTSQMYVFEAKIQSNAGAQPSFECRGIGLRVGSASPTFYVKTFSDAAYSVETDTFPRTSTVYVEVYHSGFGNGTPDPGQSTFQLKDYAKNQIYNAAPAAVSSPSARVYRMEFSLTGLGTDGWWYSLRAKWKDNGGGKLADKTEILIRLQDAQNPTTTGTVTASSTGCTEVTFVAPYTGDSNGDNSLTYRYRTPSGTGTWTAPIPVAHSASPYTIPIAGLTFGATYDVEVTYVDADGVNGTNPQTVSNILVGATCTGAGVVTAGQTPGATPSIAVTAPYTFDQNADNSLTYRYRTPSGTGIWSAPLPLAHSASPYAFTLSGLTCGATYDVEVTYIDPDGIGSGTAIQIVSNILLNNCTVAGTASATVDSCDQITVSAPFTNDANGDGDTTFERGTSAGGPWTPVCSNVTGASPRQCVDPGLAAGTSYYYRVTYADPDAVSGTAQQVIGPFTTPVCNDPPVTPGLPTANPDSCTQITVSAPFTGDTNNDSSTGFEISQNAAGPWTPVCSGVTGASPRTCIATGLTNATAYFFRVTFQDPDGVNGTNPQVIGAISTLECKVTPGSASANVDACDQITVSAPYGDDANADSTTDFERGLSATGPWTPVCSGVTGPSPRSCIDTGLTELTNYYYRVTFNDADGVNGANPQVIGPFTTPACALNGTTVVSNSAQADSCNQLSVLSTFTGDDNGDGSTQIEYNTSNTWPGTIACAALTGPSPRQCLITGLSASTSYWVRATFSDPDGVTGTNPEVLGPITTPVCGADAVAPTVLFLAPSRGTIVGGTDRFKIQVFDAGGISSVELSIDGGAYSPAVVNPNYNCGASCAVYELDIDTTAFSNGSHSVVARATDTSSNIALRASTIVANNIGGSPAGAGTLLRRTMGSRICLDCHNLGTHSSQLTSTTYGNWAIDCVTCHLPHGTTNIFLVRESLQTPNSGTAGVVFQQDDKAGGTNPQWSYLGDYSGGGNTPYTDGVCEVCHTKTNHHRNSASGGDHTHNVTTRCLTCHKHEEGFRGSGGPCTDCHNQRQDATADGIPRAQIVAGTAGSEGDDFIRPSRHVSDGTATEIVTSFDCIECHAEGDVTSSGASVKTTAEHMDEQVDLRDVDSAGGTGITASWPGKRLGVEGVDWTATTAQRDNMDSFCMGCHDAGGATGVVVNKTNPADGMIIGPSAAQALDPFNVNDTFQNANEYATLKAWRQTNGRVIDVKSLFNSTNQVGKLWASHHNLNQFTKRYSTRNTTYWPNAAWTTYTTKQGDNIQTTGETTGLHCSDCHLNEANAHGSRNSWYILSDSSGNDAKFTNSALINSTDICAKCHAPTTYGIGNTSTASRTTGHNQNGGKCSKYGGDSDFDRFASIGYIAGQGGANTDQINCLGCHAGLEPGMIHGTNSTYNPWQGGGTSKRYRFMGAGGSMRWYSPTGAAFNNDTDWEGTAQPGCYTINAADNWGACNKHNGGKQDGSFVSNRARPLEY